MKIESGAEIDYTTVYEYVQKVIKTNLENIKGLFQMSSYHTD